VDRQASYSDFKPASESPDLPSHPARQGFAELRLLRKQGSSLRQPACNAWPVCALPKDLAAAPALVEAVDSRITARRHTVADLLLGNLGQLPAARHAPRLTRFQAQSAHHESELLLDG